MRVHISFEEIPELLEIEEADLPKYAGTILNIANQWSQGTRPNVVGQMSDLIQEFPGRTFEEWKEWYSRRKPGAIDEATDRIWRMLKRIRGALAEVDKQGVRDWTEDLVLVKTFLGLRFQGAILARVAEALGVEYTPADAEGESRGIDGYIGGTPVSVKPLTYRSRHRPEDIPYEIIYYEKTESGVIVEFDADRL